MKENLLLVIIDTVLYVELVLKDKNPTEDDARETVEFSETKKKKVRSSK